MVLPVRGAAWLQIPAFAGELAGEQWKLADWQGANYVFAATIVVVGGFARFVTHPAATGAASARPVPRRLAAS